MNRTHLLLLLSFWVVLSSSTFFLPSITHGQASDDEYVVHLPLIIRGEEVSSEGLSPLEYEQIAIDLTNDYRQINGCPALTIAPKLLAAARAHSVDMANRNYFSHSNPDGKSPWDRMKDAGYDDFLSAGENIAAGYVTPQDVVQAWINSPEHHKNIVNCNYNEIGIGYEYNENSTFKHYWTQDFGQR